MKIKIPIFDGHNDSLTSVLLKEKDQGRSFLKRSEIGHIDLPRMQEGGMLGGIFGIFVPPEKEEERKDDFGFTITNGGFEIKYAKSLDYEYAKMFTDDVIRNTKDIINRSSGQLDILTKGSQLKLNKKKKIISIVLHLEGAEAIDESFENLYQLYEEGVRSIGLVWSRKNIFGEGVPYKFPGSPDAGGGLTVLGKKLVKECNKLGVVVDLAHINLAGFFDVEKITSKPLVVSHTNVHVICPSTRNIIDKQIDAVGSSKGIIGINFEPISVRRDGLHSTEGKTLNQTFEKIKKTSLNEIVNHIIYIVERLGVDYVGFGADMDGAIMPNDLKDASYFQNIVDELKLAGFSDNDIEKICWGNWERVIQETINN